MKNKLDYKLAKTMSLTTNQKIECLIYCQNLPKLKNLIETTNLRTTGIFPFINAISVVGSKQEINQILKLNFVDFASSQSQVFALMNVARKILNTEKIGQGENSTIAYIDTGISPHLDFTLGKNRIVKFVDLINNKLFPYDDNGHGTFVSGVGSGNGLISNKKYAGICPKSKIVSIKALDASGEANATKILEAMQWVYENHKKYNIKIVCMSFGSEPLGPNDPILLGAEKLWAENIVIIAAAGNSGPEYETIKSPGISSKIITVGGFNDNRLENNQFFPEFFEIAKFSSRGPALNEFKPDVVAPAVDITSCGTKTAYTSLSGTSVATPMIAGICALLFETSPNATPDEIKKQLIALAKPINLNKNQEGAGYVTFN